MLCLECRGKLEQPLLLPCGHTFCLRCLQRSTHDESLECPSCHKVHQSNATAPPFPLNASAVFLSEKLPSSAEQPTCENCEEASAAMWCVQCQCCLCQECCAATHQAKILQKHSMKPIAAKIATASVPFCQEHQQPQILFCKNDKQAVCAICHLALHQGHQVGLLSEQAEVAKAKLCGEVKLKTAGHYQKWKALGKANHAKLVQYKQEKEDLEKRLRALDTLISEAQETAAGMTKHSFALEEVASVLNMIVDSVADYQLVTDEAALRDRLQVAYQAFGFGELDLRRSVLHFQPDTKALVVEGRSVRTNGTGNQVLSCEIPSGNPVAWSFKVEELGRSGSSGIGLTFQKNWSTNMWPKGTPHLSLSNANHTCTWKPAPKEDSFPKGCTILCVVEQGTFTVTNIDSRFAIECDVSRMEGPLRAYIFLYGPGFSALSFVDP